MQNIIVPKGKLDYFRTLARQTDLEIQAFMFGRVLKNSVRVEEIIHPKVYATQLVDTVQWYQEEYDRVVREQKERDLILLGDIHSHPNALPILSETDHKVHVEEHALVSGICATLKGRTKVAFWVADSSLPLTIKYV